MSTNDLSQYANIIASIILVPAAIFSVHYLYTSVWFEPDINNLNLTKNAQKVFENNESYTKSSLLKLYRIDEQQLICHDIGYQPSCISQITERVEQQLGDWNRFEVIQNVLNHQYNLVDMNKLNEFVENNFAIAWLYDNPDECLSYMKKVWKIYNTETSPLTIIENIILHDILLFSDEIVQLLS